MKKAAIAAPINRSPDRLSGGVHQILELGRSRFLVDLLDGSKFAGQSLESGLIHLALGIGLFGLVGAAMKITHDLGDGDRIAC